MRAVREYFGADHTTVTYEQEITGVGGNVDEFFILCEAGRQPSKPAVRTTVYFTHDEMVQLLADYRQHHPIEGTSRQIRLPDLAGRWRIGSLLHRLLTAVRLRRR